MTELVCHDHRHGVHASVRTHRDAHTHFTDESNTAIRSAAERCAQREIVRYVHVPPIRRQRAGPAFAPLCPHGATVGQRIRNGLIAPRRRVLRLSNTSLEVPAVNATDVYSVTSLRLKLCAPVCGISFQKRTYSFLVPHLT